MSGGSAVFGAGTALCWGVSDICARLSGRASGVIATTFALMVIGSVLLVLYTLLVGAPFSWDTSGFWLIGASGVGMAVGTLLIYQALTMGPVSLASPTVASYPAITVPVSIAFGSKPDLPHWIAMGGTMIGVWLVARAVGKHERGGLPDYERRNVRITLLLSIGCAVIFAMSLLAADLAIDRYGWVQTLIGGRIIGAVMMAGIILVRLRPLALPKLPPRAVFLLVAVGILDTSGNALLYAGMAEPNGEFAIVASVAYTAVTTVIARIFLREPVSLIQWLGIGLIVGGVAVLAGMG